MLVARRLYQNEAVTILTATIPITEALDKLAAIRRFPNANVLPGGHAEGALWFEVLDEDDLITDPVCFAPGAPAVEALIRTGLGMEESFALLSDSYAAERLLIEYAEG